MSLTAAPRGRLRKIEILIDYKHMSTNDIQQASTADADNCADLRTKSGQAITGKAIISLAFRSRDHLLEQLCMKVFGASPIFPDPVPPRLTPEMMTATPTVSSAAQCICRECDTPRPIQGGASKAILTGKSLEIEQPCATCGRITWCKPFNVDALRGLPPAPVAEGQAKVISDINDGILALQREVDQLRGDRDRLAEACRALLDSEEVQKSWPLDGTKRAKKPKDTHSSATAAVKFRRLLAINAALAAVKETTNVPSVP